MVRTDGLYKYLVKKYNFLSDIKIGFVGYDKEYYLCKRVLIIMFSDKLKLSYMRKIFLSVLLAFSTLIVFGQQYVPSQDVKQSQKAFQNDRFGVFIHWGIYSMLGAGEWVMNRKNINYTEYPHLADGFYPSKFDADQWVKTFKDAGAKYITITSRHHDGFSMFKTAESKYNVVDGTPFHRDVLAEIAKACKKYGLALHVYYSLLDWSREDYPLGRTGLGVGRPRDKQNYQSYLSFMNRQLREILTNYGPVRCIWFDGWWDHDSDPTPFDWHFDQPYKLIHSLQPLCLVANNHHQVPFEGEDIQVFEQDLPGENSYGLSGQKISHLPLETCLTMNDSWGYDITDKDYKSADYLIQKLVTAAGKDANLLLNVGPRPDGELPVEAVERLHQIGQWLKVHGETIYGTRGGIVAPHDWGVTTQKGNKLFVHILKWGDRGLFLPLTARKIAAAKMYESGKAVKVTKAVSGVFLEMPVAPSGVDTIVELDLK